MLSEKPYLITSHFHNATEEEIKTLILSKTLDEIKKSSIWQFEN